MRILKRLFIVRREGLEMHWWHRLSRVLIYGSTLLVVLALLFVVLFLKAWEWKSYKYSAYSFETSYADSKGRETNCGFDSRGRVSSIIASKKCGIKNPTDFLIRYEKATSLESFLEVINRGDITNTGIYRGLIDSGRLDNLRVKRITDIDYLGLLRLLSLVVIFGLGWLIFWESIVYRSVIFIIYGHKAVEPKYRMYNSIGNVMKENPNSMGSIFLSLGSIFSVIILRGYVGLFIWFFALNRLSQAQKQNEGFKRVALVFSIMTPIALLLGIAAFVMAQLSKS